MFVGRSCSPFLQSIVAPPLLGGMGGGAVFSCLASQLHCTAVPHMVSLQLYPIPEGCEGPGCRTSGVNRAIRKMDICDEGGVNLGIEHRPKNLKHFLPGRSKVSQEGLVDS